MKVAFFTQWWPPENAGVPASLARELSRIGHDVDVVTGFPNYPTGKLFPGYELRWRQFERREGLRTLRVPLYPSHDRSTVGRSANYLSFSLASALIGAPHVRHADVSYVYHPPITAALPAMVLRQLRGTPFVLHIQDLWPESVVQSGMVGDTGRRAMVGKVLAGLCQTVYRAAAHILVISPGFKRLLVERGVAAEKITVVYNWADESVFQPHAADPAVRATLGPPDKRVALYAGNFGDFQGLEDAMLAAEAVGRAEPFHLTLIGDGLARPRLEALQRDRGIANVSILPSRPASEMPPLLAAADAHLVKLQDLAFFAVTIPGKTQVAMASAKPLIMAVRGDAADLVVKARAGFTCEPDVPGLTAAFTAFAQTPAEGLRAMGQSALGFYREQLSLDRAGRQVEACLRSAAATLR